MKEKKIEHAGLILAIILLIALIIACMYQNHHAVQLTRKNYWAVERPILTDYTAAEEQNMLKLLNDKETAFNKLSYKKISRLNFEIEVLHRQVDERILLEIKENLEQKFSELSNQLQHLTVQEKFEYKLATICFNLSLIKGNREHLSKANNCLAKMKKIAQQPKKSKSKKENNAKNGYENISNPDNDDDSYSSNNSQHQSENADNNVDEGNWDFDDPFEHGCTSWGNCTEEGDGEAEVGTGW